MPYNPTNQLIEEQLWYYLTHSPEVGGKMIHTFAKSISLKVNIIARLEDVPVV